jgi:hypothetical protein
MLTSTRTLGLHLVVTSSAADTSEFLRVDWKRVLTVLLQHGKRLLVVHLPHPVGVTRNPDFWKSDELAPSLTGLVDEVDGLLNTSFEVEPAWLRCDLEFD